MASPKKWLKDDDNISFSLINEDMLDELISRGEVVLPKKKINIPKDMQWNLKTFNSELIQGILNGESMQEIADRIFPEIMLRLDLTGKTLEEIYSILKKNEQSAIRNARTMTTAAECGGRLKSYQNLADRGVIQKKVWMSTPDDRTRPTHVDLDGEEQDIDQPFSNGCMFPADSNGPAEEVWQCRCSIRDHIVGFRRSDGSISYVGGSRGNTMHDRQMDEEKARRKSTKKKMRR